MTKQEFDHLKCQVEKGIHPRVSVNIDTMNNDYSNATCGTWVPYKWKDLQSKKLLSNTTRYRITGKVIVFYGVMLEWVGKIIEAKEEDSLRYYTSWDYMYVDIVPEKDINDLL